MDGLWLLPQISDKVSPSRLKRRIPVAVDSGTKTTCHHRNTMADLPTHRKRLTPVRQVQHSANANRVSPAQSGCCVSREPRCQPFIRSNCLFRANCVHLPRAPPSWDDRDRGLSSNDRPSIVNQVFQSVGRDVQCGGVDRPLFTACSPGPFGVEYAVDFLFGV